MASFSVLDLKVLYFLEDWFSPLRFPVFLDICRTTVWTKDKCSSIINCLICHAVVLVLHELSCLELSLVVTVTETETEY